MPYAQQTRPKIKAPLRAPLHEVSLNGHVAGVPPTLVLPGVGQEAVDVLVLKRELSKEDLEREAKARDDAARVAKENRKRAAKTAAMCKLFDAVRDLQLAEQM